MKNRSSKSLRAQGYLQGWELSEEFQELYAADHRAQARITEARCRLYPKTSKTWDGIRTCPKSGISHRPQWDPDSRRPSGRRLTSLELASQPKYSGTAKDERRCLEDCGMAISDAEVKRMFGRDYAAQRTTGVQHQLFGHQNFNDRATAQSYLAGAAAEAIGRENIAFVTELLGADLHIGPGKLRRDPKILIRDLLRKYRQLFPDHQIYVVGFFENILREISHAGKSRARSFIADVSGAPAKQKKSHARRKEAQSSAEDGGGWRDRYIDSFLADCFPQEALQRVLADMYSGSTSTAPLVEVPHAHLLIAAFDVHGRPMPFSELKDQLHQAARARYQLNVQQLYALDRKPGAAEHLAMMARNAFEQAAQCIRYAIKRSGNLISDRDLQFRTIVRGTAPNQGFFDVLLLGKNLVKRSRAKRIIPPTSVLGQVIAERRRIAPIVGIHCPNNGEPENIKQIESRLLGTETPMVLIDGKARRSTNSTVSNSFGKSSGTLFRQGIPSIDGLRSTMISWAYGPAKWFKKRLGGERELS